MLLQGPLCQALDNLMQPYVSEMHGYQFLISVSYPSPFKTIRILSVQMLLTAIRILTASLVPIMAR